MLAARHKAKGSRWRRKKTLKYLRQESLASREHAKKILREAARKCKFRLLNIVTCQNTFREENFYKHPLGFPLQLHLFSENRNRNFPSPHWVVLIGHSIRFSTSRQQIIIMVLSFGDCCGKWISQNAKNSTKKIFLLRWSDLKKKISMWWILDPRQWCICPKEKKDWRAWEKQRISLRLHMI